jgi:predicted negative regulator of RcsB-dependent stress response
MDLAMLLTIVGLLLTNAGFMFGMWKYFDAKNAKTEAKISRAYERFDEHKKECEAKYVMQNTCKLLHSTTVDNLKGVEGRMDIRFDKVEEKMRVTNDKLEKKIESAFSMILDLLKSKRE